MIWQKVRVVLFWLGAFVLLCIGTTGIIVVQAMSWIQNVVVRDVQPVILRNRQ